MSNWIFKGNVGMPISSGAPSGRVNGQVWWDSADNKFKGTDPSGTDVTIQGGSVATTSIVVWQQIAVHDATQVVGESFFDFTGLNGDVDIEYHILGRWIKNDNLDVALKVIPNNIGGNNFGVQYLYATNATTNAFRDNPGNGMVMDYRGGALQAGTSTFEAVLMAKTGAPRTMVSRGGCADLNSAIFSALFFACWWNDTTTNITSLRVSTPGNTSIAKDSHFELWAPRTVKVVT